MAVPHTRRPPSRAALLLATWPGRAIVAGVALRLLVFLVGLTGVAGSSLLDLLDTLAGVSIAAGAVYVFVQLFAIAKRRLLWRVRRKLILSYLFIGFVPVVLIASFFALIALLLFFNFSSYMLQAEVRSIEQQAQSLAATAAVEIQRAGGGEVSAILGAREREARAAFAGASLAVVAADRVCAANAVAGGDGAGLGSVVPVTVGPWAHVDPPQALPSWIGCDGVAGLFAYTHPTQTGDDTHLLVRAVAFPDRREPSFAVVVDLPINGPVVDRLRASTGVDVRTIINTDVQGANRPLSGRATEAADGADGRASSGPLSWVTLLDYRDWATGKTSTIVVATQLAIGDVYRRIAAAQGQIGNRVGQTLLLVLLVVVGGLFLIIEAVAFIVGSALARSITGSVHELFTGTERVQAGDYSHPIAITAADQLGDLARSFNNMTVSVEQALLEAAEKKRLEGELRIAHDIQMSLLPQGPLAMPGLSVTAVCIPAREVGGDYYDFLPLDDHRVGVLIADVSGKGTSAALYMAELKGLVLSLSQIHMSPRDLLISANRLIAAHLDARSFITMTYAVLDLHARTITYARAGHTPLIHVPGSPGSGRQACILPSEGMVVGLKLDNGEIFERLLEEQTMPLEVGDIYLFYTDGISEAMNGAEDCFGEVRLSQFIEDHARFPPEELRERVLREVQAFVGDAPQHDDMTMILLKVEELPEPAGAGTGRPGAADAVNRR